jgi:hypothetical protein
LPGHVVNNFNFNLWHTQENWRKIKRETLRAIDIDENCNMGTPLQPLKYKHFAQLFKVAWDHAFTRERNMTGWEKEGILSTFNRKEYLRSKEDLDAAEKPTEPPHRPKGAPTARVMACLVLAPLLPQTAAPAAPLKFSF